MIQDCREIELTLRLPHPKQRRLVNSRAKRLICRAGRRSGKTTGLATRAVRKFLQGKRVLYAAPTLDQTSAFWDEVKRALEPAWDLYRTNQGQRLIENRDPESKQRLRAKTAWNADTLRGDYADELILDEFQLMAESAWDKVGAPMLIDNGGNATFLYTPPSLSSRVQSKAIDKRHASKMFGRALLDPDWQTISFTSHDNPHLSQSGLARAAKDMTQLAYRMEILAEDVDDNPKSLWTRENIKHKSVRLDDLVRIVVGVDPTGTKSGDECGIVAAGVDAEGIGYILCDESEGGLSPDGWASKVVSTYDRLAADRIVAEVNFGGDMVESTIRAIDENVSYENVRASRGKAIRAEPIAALYERGRVFHTSVMTELEDQMCLWSPDEGWSPDRMDALVWALSELMLLEEYKWV